MFLLKDNQQSVHTSVFQFRNQENTYFQEVCKLENWKLIIYVSKNESLGIFIKFSKKIKFNQVHFY